MLDVVTKSTDVQLTTTAAVKDLIGATGSSDDTLIDSLITRASRWAETFVGRPLTAQAYRETLSGFGSRRLSLSCRPVRAVTGFWGATDTGTATTMLTSEYKVDHDAGFFERNAGWAWDAPGIPRPFSIPLAPAYWPGEERAPWLADYVAGFTYDGIDTGSALYSTVHGSTSTGRTLPEDIEEAVRYRVAAMYEGNEGVVERSVGDLRVKYATFVDGRAVDPAADMLAPYREVA